MFGPRSGHSLRDPVSLLADPLEETPNESNCWFWLTDGWYWIELAGHELRYSPRTLQWCGREGASAYPTHPYVDYYVVRLWEDLLYMTPEVMEPVPADLVPFMAGDPGRWPSGGEEEWSEQAWAAARWHGGHELDFLYLRASPDCMPGGPSWTASTR